MSDQVDETAIAPGPNPSHTEQSRSRGRVRRYWDGAGTIQRIILGTVFVLYAVSGPFTGFGLLGGAAIGFVICCAIAGVWTLTARTIRRSRHRS